MNPDAIVVGAGHNGLTCAAYLARAGRDVLVVEARDTIGGCASTVDALGARVNICNCDHTMVLASGIVAELGLAGHGLRYLDVDPVQVAVGWGGEPAFVQWRDVDRTVEGIARVDRSAAAAYRRYVRVVEPLARLVLAAAATRPAAVPLAVAAARHGGRGAALLLSWRRRSLLDVLSALRLPPWLQAAMVTTGPGVWGVSADTPGTGLAAVGGVLRHLVGVGRPVGGSGALPAALGALIAAHGGRIATGRRVTRVLVAGGAARGVRLADGTVLHAGTVVAAVDPRTVLVEWLDGVPNGASARWARMPRHDGYQSKVDAIVDQLPALAGDGVLPAELAHVPTTVVSPTLAEQVAAAADRLAGRVSDPPMFLVNAPSVLDPTMRPPGGGHVLSLEVLWTPYAVPGGWRGSAEPWRWLERLAALDGNGFLGGVRDWRVMTPEDYERDFGLPRGYAPSFQGGPLAALLGRQRELSRYATPVRGLFLSGAGTFPGAGVWGASGRNAAMRVLRA
jgi:phytoene dehydrogenase-like protein